MAADYMPEIEALLKHIADGHAAHPDPGDVSSRTPGKMSAQSNSADQIEPGLQADGHRMWGFVVYRCTYASDTDWELCMQRIHAKVRAGMKFCNGLDLLKEGRFKLTVIEDPNEFDGASTFTVRQHFREWCSRTLHEEQGTTEKIESRRKEPNPWPFSLAVRYRFSLQIDEASLQSIVSDKRDAWVNLIRDDWEMKDFEAQETYPEPHWDITDEELADLVEEYPPIEGNTEDDVGWMKLEYGSAMPTFYQYLRDPNTWTVFYSRPPYVVAI